MGVVETSMGIYEYEDKEFISGSKKINREISKNNLLILKKCFDENNLSFGLIYGTLLGAIREKNFIAHDEDTDIFILYEDRGKLLNLLFELRALGLEVGRSDNSLISFLKDGEYIDVYFFKKSGFKNRECEGYLIKSDVLENLDSLDFLGEIFKVPKNPEKLLTLLYGEDWKIPDKNAKPKNYGPYLTIKLFIKNHSEMLFKILSWTKKHIDNIKLYFKN